MAAALALAITLVVVVAAVSLFFYSQGQLPHAERATAPSPPRPRGRRPRSPEPAVGTEASPGRQPRRGKPERAERGRAAKGARASKEEPERPPDPEQVFGDLRPLNKQAPAVVLSVVDERVLGPVTRCKLTLRVEPKGEDSFEVTTRVAFPTPEERASVKVGTRVPVRYDSEDHRRVVVEMGGLSEG